MSETLRTVNSTFTCPLCGHSFDPAEHAACQSCPLVKGCQMVCCPACGYETINPEQSKLANFASRLFAKLNSVKGER